MKRTISLLLVFCIVFSMLPLQAMAAETKATAQPPAVTPFTDVNSGDWFYDAVQYAKTNGFFSGTGPTIFAPGGTVTRGMFVTVLGRMAGVNAADYAGDTGFTDVPQDAYYAPYVKWAAQYGITGGTGGKRFSPDLDINRQQMATLFVRYFDAFKVAYGTGAKITTTPADLDDVAAFAKESVLKLWKAGLLSGDGKRFDPQGNATRAQVATLCMGVDKSVETWYKEPGIASERVSVDPGSTAKPIKKPKPDTDYTTYYEVKFHAPEGMEKVELPKETMYAANTAITSLPTPFKMNTAFLGWYYDAGFTKPIQNSDKLTKSIDLYASFAEGVTQLSAQETPNYVTTVGVATTFTFQVKADSVADLKRDLTLKNITAVNADVAYTVTDSGAGIYTISATLSGGQTYKAELPEGSKALFLYKGEVQLASIRVFNFITTKEETLGLDLAKDLKYIPSSQVTGMTGSAFDGLFTATVGDAKTATVKENTTTGTFTYKGKDIAVGDTVSIYSGTQPDLRKLETTGTAADGDVAYVTVTAVNGDVYTYTSADSADVMFTPDVLPIPGTADTDGDSANNSITVPASVLDFSADKYATAGLSSQTVVEKGDFIVLYTGEFGVAAVAVASAGDAPVYGKITGVTAPTGDGTSYVITYTDATEADIMAAMDIYSTRNEKIEVTPEQVKAIEADMEKQAMESGFVEEAAQYLTALALETDGFRELSGDMDLKSYTMETADGKPLTEGEMALMADGSRVKITKQEISATVATGQLVHFQDSYGVRVELALDFALEITPKQGSENKIVISMNAIFDQEVMLSVNVTGGAIWKWAWIFPYIYDYQLNANFDVGTYTGIGVTATAKTVGPESDDGYDWKPVTGNKFESKLINIGKQITDLMDKRDEFLGKKMVDENGEEIEWSGGGGGGLADKYSAMIENADASWIDLFRKEIFSMESSVDPFHILVFGISADFVVSANMYITIGMTFEYANAKRYNFSLMLFHKQTSNETIDLAKEYYQFDFYVMGTLGIRAGIELEVGVGLFSLKLDSIGITAELGAYAQLWGYFYYSLRWEAESNDKVSSYSGAMFIDMGIYLKITFKAQLFSSDKLTYQPTLLDKQWPLFTIGAEKNVFDFAYKENDKSLSYDVKKLKSFTLPTSLFEMSYMDMKSGKIYDGSEQDAPAQNYDDATEKHFRIEFSNKAFSYEPSTNTIKVTPAVDSIEENGKMAITWGGSPLAFTSQPISRTLQIKWSDPTSGNYIAFDSKGGSAVDTIFKLPGVAVVPPANPTKQGYDFVEWQEDDGRWYTFPDVMPAYDTEVYAKWKPATNTQYTVEHYQQSLNSSTVYDLVDTEHLTGKTDTKVSPERKTYTGFTAPQASQLTILPNGSAVLKYYYTRNTYDLKFTLGTQTEDTTGKHADAAVYKLKFGAPTTTPRLKSGGYTFVSWDVADSAIPATMPAENLTYHAQWKPDPNTAYRVEHYMQNKTGALYSLEMVEMKTGETGKILTLADEKNAAATGLTYQRGTVDGKPATEAPIKKDGSLVIKLYYDRKTVDANYHVAGGIDFTESHRYGAPVTQPTDPVKAGYTFDGWYTDSAYTARYTFGKEMPETALELYGRFVAATNTKYVVNHHIENTADGNYTIQSRDEKYGTTDETLTLDTLKNASLEVPGGITYKEAKIGSATATATEATIAADGSLVINLYYQRVSHTLTFKPENGEAATIRTGKYGAAVTPPTVRKTGYTFAGWSPTAPATMPAEDASYTAQWTAGNVAYKVEHYQQNADNDGYTLKDTDNRNGTTGATATAVAKSYANFTLNDKAADAKPSGTITANGDLVLKLYYNRQTFTLTFAPGEGTLDASAATQTLKHGATVTTPTPTRAGYSFGDWHMDSASGAAFNKVMPAANLTVYASWNAGSVNYKVEHYVMGTDGNYPTTVSGTDLETKSGIADAPLTLSALKKSSCEVTGGIAYDHATVGGKTETLANIAADGTLVIKLYYARQQHTLAWAENGGTLTGGTTAGPVYYGAELTAPTGTKENSELGGWKPSVPATMPAQNATYTAQWKAATFTVIYRDQGGTVLTGTHGANPPTRYTAGTAVNLVNPTKVHHTFGGWFDTLDCTGVAVTNIPTTATGNKTFYAKWIPESYTITYMYGSTELKDTTNPATYTYGIHVYTLNDYVPPSAAGMKFGGWYTNVGLTEKFTSSTLGSLAFGDKTIYLKLVPFTYTVSFNANGGTGTMASQAFEHGKAQNLTANAFTKEGYTFTGWATAAAGVKVYDDGASVENLSATDGATVQLYALWEKTRYPITYEMGGHGTNPDNPPNYDGSVAVILSNLADVPGWTFAGWFTTSNFDPATEIATGSNAINAGESGAKTFYAKWTKLDMKIANSGELVLMAQNIIANPDYAALEYNLTADIDMTGTTGTTWTPIGTDANPFIGIFDGGNFTINGLDNALFGTVGTGGTVKNLKLNSAIITKNVEAGVSVGVGVNERLGMIACTLNGGTIQDCELVLYSTITPYNNDQVPPIVKHVGGAVGYNQGGTITNVTSNCTITVPSFVVWNYGCLVGTDVDGKISNCRASGATMIGGNEGLGVRMGYQGGIGGLVGSATSSTITNCVGGVVPTVNIYSPILTFFEKGFGGLIGIGSGSLTVDGCSTSSTNVSISNTGNTSTRAESAGVGGLIGIVDLAENCTVTVKNSYAAAHVVKADAEAGGLIGKATGLGTLNVENCSSSANVVVTKCSLGTSGGLIGALGRDVIVNLCNCINSSTGQASQPGRLIFERGYWAPGTVTVENCFWVDAAAAGFGATIAATVTSCGTMTSTHTMVTPGTAANCLTDQKLTYSGTLLEMLNAWVDAHPNGGYTHWQSDVVGLPLPTAP